MRSATVLTVFLLIATIVVEPSSSRAAEADEFVPEQLVCRVISNIYIDSINAAYNTTTLDYLGEVSSYLLETQPGLDVESLATIIALDSNVVYCDANYILSAPEPVQGSQPFIDTKVGGTEFRSQPATTTTNLAAAQTISTGGSVTVGVIDVGINLDHPEMTAIAASGYDFVDADSIATDDPGGSASGHGTFVAGVVNLVAPDAAIRAYRVLDTAGRGNGYDIAQAIISAIDDGCRVINLSMVMSARHGSIDDAIEFARNNDVLVVAAAGNDSTDSDRFPARDSYTLSVAAVDSLNLKADFSSYGSHVDVCAPGTGILAPYLDTLYAAWDGTSFAAPFVAGQAAMLFAANPSATWNDVVDAITSSAIDLDDLNPQYEGNLGAGLINPEAALQQLAIVCGDLNGDHSVADPIDLTYLVDYVIAGGVAPVTHAAGDLDGDGSSGTAVDLAMIVDYLFAGGTAPTCAL